jgi:threonine dehydrogenase-like Zn-dependent dehydrogenase
MLVSGIMIAPTLANCWSELLTSRVPSKQMGFDFLAGIGDQKIVTTLCPGGKERMRRLMELVRANRVDLKPLLTHAFPLDDIIKAYKFFEQRSDGVVKVAIKP